MILELTSNKVDLHYNELGANAINFYLDSGYFSIQTGIYLEPDDDPDLDPYFELNREENSQAGGFDQVIFSHNKITIVLDPERHFMDRYCAIHLTVPVTDDIIDFFNNFLFLGKIIRYDETIKEASRIQQTAQREILFF